VDLKRRGKGREGRKKNMEKKQTDEKEKGGMERRKRRGDSTVRTQDRGTERMKGKEVGKKREKKKKNRGIPSIRHESLMAPTQAL